MTTADIYDHPGLPRLHQSHAGGPGVRDEQGLAACAGPPGPLRRGERPGEAAGRRENVASDRTAPYAVPRRCGQP
jgi:hypothetical protein